MSKRKGVSLNEKTKRMLQIFHEKGEFFNLKELESIAPKEKGIVVQSVKDVLQGLVDDGLVSTDKIGTSSYYWAFPGEKHIAIEQRIAESNKQIVETEFRNERLKEELKKEQVGKEDTEERRAILSEIQDLTAQVAKLREQIAKFSIAGPEVIAKLKAKTEETKEAANTWTDNIFAIESWCRRKFDMNEETIRKQLEIPLDLEYVG